MVPLPHVPGVEHHHVEANGVRLHVAEAGEGEPVLLIHGWPQHWYEWRLVLPQLAERHRVICPDLRGFGWSEAPPGDYRKEALAQDMAALVDALGLERVRVAGHDWGGLVGLILALRRPDLVERLLVLSIVHLWPRRDLPTLIGTLGAAHVPVLAAPVVGGALLRRVPGFVKTLIRAGATRRENLTDDVLEAYAARLAEPERARATTALYRTFATREAPAILNGRYAGERLTVPTRMIVGSDDPAIGEDALRGFERNADDMTLELVPGAGHFLPEEVPDLVVERALALFGSAPESRTRSSGS